MERQQLQQWLLMERSMFQKNEFKQAKSWLLEHNYPPDLIKGIIDFNIVDLANLMFEAEKNLYGKETRDLQDKTQDFNG